MKVLKTVFFLIIAMTIFDCSDGMEVGLSINSIIKENNIERIVIKEKGSSLPAGNVYAVKDVVVGQQFIDLNKTEFINIRNIKRIKVNDKELALEF